MLVPKDAYGRANIRRGFIDFLAGKGAQVAGGLATMLLLVRLLPVNEYAVYVTVAALSSLIGSLSLFGMDRVASRYVPQALLHGGPGTLAAFVRNLLAWRLLAVGLLTAITAVLWPWLGPVLGLPEAKHQPWLAAATLAWGVLHALQSFQIAVMQSLMSQRAIRDATSVSMALKVLILAVLMLSVGKIAAPVAVLVSLTADAIACGWMALASVGILNRTGGHLAQGQWQPDWKEVGRTAWQNYLTAQLALPTQVKPLQLVAAVTLAAPEVAAFGFVTSLASNLRMLLPLYLFRSLLEPVLIGRYVASRHTHEVFAGIAEPLARSCAMVVLCMTGILVVAGYELVRVLAGPAYATHAWMMPILVLGMLPACWRTLSVVVANGMDENRSLLTAAAFAFIGASVLIASTFMGFGIVPLLAAETVFSVISVFYFRWIKPASKKMLPLNGSRLIGMALASILAVLISIATVTVSCLPIPVLSGSMCSLLGALTVLITFVLMLLLFRLVTFEEIKIIRDLIARP
jgi:hypothetical protein